ncbi:MAG: aminotransferase class I/II-fold pyridoxal phosphate-dependent enzyme, partial [Chloroflexota bacterium]
MAVEPRPELAALRPVAHGAVEASELAAHGLAPDAVVDFSVNTNPLGPPQGVLAAVAKIGAAGVWRYPDPTALPLRRRLAARLRLDPAQIIVGNGSSELIWLLAMAYAHPAPSGALICGPTFGEYERACRLLGAAVRFETATPETGFR